MPRPYPEPDAALGAAIRKLRNERRLSQQRLAAKAGYTTNVVLHIEAAHVSPSWVTVRSVARALDVSIGEVALAIEAIESQEQPDAP